MADDKTDLEDDLDDGLDDLDFDLYDDPDTSVDGEDPGSRQPVRKLTTSFLDGVKDDITDRRDLTRKARKVLPEGYSSALEDIDEVSSIGGNLLNTIVRETRDGVRDFKRAAGQVLRNNEEKVPDKIKKRLEKHLVVEERRRRPTEEEIREDRISSSMADIFDTQIEADQERENKRDADQAVRDNIEERRHVGLTQNLQDIRQAVHRQVSYQDQVTARYQRRSLELQYRQFYATRDIRSISEQSSKDLKEALQSIVTNTALPEYRKIELTEVGGRMIRDRFIEGIQNRMVDSTRNFWSKTRKNLEGAVKERAQGVGNMLSMVGGQASAMGEASDMPGMDGYEMVGGMGGGIGASIGFDKLAPKAQKLLEKNPHIMELASRAARTSRDIPKIINEWAKEDPGTGFKGGIRSFLQDILAPESMDDRIHGERLEDSDQAAIFDKLTRRSIVEIIPGYLSRIHHEIYALRTGDDDPSGRLGYDLRERKFSTQGEIGDNVRDTLFSEDRLNASRDRLEAIYDLVDPDGVLSAKARATLGQQILRDNFEGRAFKPERYTDTSEFRVEGDADTMDEITGQFKSRFGITEEMNEEGETVRSRQGGAKAESLLNKLSSEYHNLTRDTNDPVNQMGVYSDLGYRDALESLGIMNRERGEDRANFDRIFEIYQRGGFGELDEDADEKFRKKSKSRRASQREEEDAETLNRFKSLRGLGESVRDKTKATGVWAKGKYHQGKEKATHGFEHTQDFVNQQYQRGRNALTPYYQQAKDGIPEFGDLSFNRLKGSAGQQFQQGRDYIDPLYQQVKGTTASHLTQVRDRFQQQRSRMGGHPSKGISHVNQDEQEIGRGRPDLGRFDFLSTDRTGSSNILGHRGADGGYSADHTTTALDADLVDSKSGGQTTQPSAEKIKERGPLMKVFNDIRNRMGEITETLTGKQDEGEVSQDTKKLIAAMEKGSPEKDDSKIALLSSILENVEAIAALQAAQNEAASKGVRGIAKKTGRMLGKIGGSVGNFYLGGLRMFGGGMAGIGRMMGGAGKAGGNLLGRMFSSRGEKETVEDVYTRGSPVPTLTAKGMSEGQYYDSETGEVISSLEKLKDLKGDVVDGSGQLVATLQELSQGLFNQQGKKVDPAGLGSYLTGMIKSGAGMIGNFYGNLFKPVRMLAGGVKRGVRGVKDFIQRVRDVYVKGEPNPRLLATVIKNGGYVSANTGRPIYRVDEIDGDVLDRQGNVVLSLTDMRQGLVDVNGQPLEFFKRMGNRIKRLLSMPGRALGWGFETAKGMVRKGKDMLTGSGGAGAEGGEEAGGKVKISKKQLKVLEQIRDLIKDRLPDDGRGRYDKSGSGFRDGSWQELMADKEEAGAEKKEKSFKEKIKSQFGRFAPGGAAAAAAAGGQPRWEDPDGDEDGEGGDTTIVPVFGGRSLLRGGKRALGRAGRFLGRGGGAIKGGVTALGGKALGGLAAAGVGTKIAAGGAALLAAPFMAKIAIGAAVIGGGYLAYKYFTGSSLGNLAKVRMYQYGIDEEQDDRLQKARFLEEQVYPHISFDFGEVELNTSSINMGEVAEGFGVDIGDERQVERFVGWFQLRFLPVYLTHIGKLRELSSQMSLEDIDKELEPGEKQEFLEGIRSISHEDVHPYDYLLSPFTEHGRLNITRGDIEQVMAEATDDIESEKRREGQSVLNRAREIVPFMKSDEEKEEEEIRRNEERSADEKEQREQEKRQARRDEETLTKRRLDIKGQNVTINVLPREVNNAVDSVRYRAYGMKEVTSMALQKIHALEEEALEHLEIDSDGIAHFAGDVERIAEEHYGSFLGRNWRKTSTRRKWREWYTSRFIESYLVYVNGLLKIDRNVSSAKEKLAQYPTIALEIARKLLTLRVSAGDGNPYIWDIDVHPWPHRDANKNASSVDEFMKVLEEAAKTQDQEVIELKPKRGSDDVSDKDVDDDFDNFIPAGQFSGSSRKDMEERRERYADSVRRELAGETGEAAAWYAQEQSDNQHNGSFALGGQVVKHPGQGTGGDINDIPMPTGDGSWDAHRETIVRAAQMAGVDPGVMAAKAALESSFRSSAKAGTSSATGLYQFIDSTWREMLSKYGSKYGISPNASRTDPRANALMAAEYLKENEKVLKRAIDRDITDVDHYAAHFMGGSGARRLLTSNQKENAVRLFPNEAAANRPIFYENGRPRTVGEVYGELDRRMSVHRDRYSDRARALAERMEPLKPQRTDVASSSESGAGPVPVVNYDDLDVVTSGSGHEDTAVASRPTSSDRGVQTFLNPVGMSSPDNAARRSLVETPTGASNVQAVSHHIEQERFQAESRDEQNRQRVEEQNAAVENISDILFKSLETQVSMDDKLEKLLNTVNDYKSLRKEQMDIMQARLDEEDQRQQEDSTRRTSADLNPRELRDPIVSLRRQIS